MATYYLPSSSGWGEDHGYAYSIRLKIVQSYNASTNKSTLTITPQFKGGSNGVSHGIVSGTTLKAGSTTLLDLGSPYGFYETGGSWVDLKNLSTNEPETATHTVSHNADGSASVSFTFRGQTSGGGVVCSFFNAAAATLSLQETRTYTLTISAGTGSTITVKKGNTTLSNGATIAHGDVLTISFGASTGYNLSTHTVNGSSFTSGNTHTVSGAVTVAATAAKKTYTLTISAGTGSTITVKRGGTTLSDGATITHGDVLTVSFGASTGYNLSTHTVNGATFTSGNTHTVSGSVTVAATAAKKTYTLTISAGTGSTVTVKRNGTALSSGATITHGDVLTISFAASAGYAISTHTVNGSSFTSGNTHTVSGAVTVAATATRQRSTIASCSSQAMTQGTIELSMNRSGSNWHKATVKKGNTVLETSAAFSSTLSISVPRSWFTNAPNDTSFSVTVSVQSYTTSACTTTVGSPVTKSVTIKADSGMKPVINAGYASDAPYNTGAAAGFTHYISGYSKAQITIDGSKLDMSAAVGASVASISVKGGGVTDTSAPYRTGILKDTETVTVTVTDTRGRKATKTLTIQCEPYASPLLSGISVYRCDSNGNEDEEGTRYAVTATAVFSSIAGENTLTLTANGTTLTSGTRKIINASLQPDQTYTVTILAEDGLGNTATVVRTLPGRKWAMKFRADGQGVGFGKAPENSKTLELPEDWEIRIGAARYWGKSVRLSGGTSTTIQLPTYTQFIVSPQRGTTWIVNTRSASDVPDVGVLSNLVSNSALTCVGAADCSITLANTSSYSYSFSIKML